MTVDPIGTWLGPDNGHAVSMDEPPKSRGDNRPDDPSRDPVGTVRLYSIDLRDDAGLAIRWSDPADTIEQHPWLILGSDGPQKLSNDTVRGYPRVRLGARADDDIPAIRLQALRLPGDRYLLVFDNVTDPSVFDGVNMDQVRDKLGAVGALFLAVPIEVL